MGIDIKDIGTMIIWMETGNIILWTVIAMMASFQKV